MKTVISYGVRKWQVLAKQVTFRLQLAVAFVKLLAIIAN